MRLAHPSVCIILAFILNVSFGCETPQNKAFNPSAQQVAEREERLASREKRRVAAQCESFIKDRDRLLSQNHIRGRGFGAVRTAISSLYRLYREAGIFSYQEELTIDQRRALMLAQLETISLAMQLERYHMANMGRTADQGLSLEAYSFAELVASEYPRRWPNYITPGMVGVEIEKLLELSSSFRGRRNSLFNDAAVLARSGFILIEHNIGSGIQNLIDAMEREPDDIHVRAVGALVSKPGSDIERAQLMGLPESYAREVRVVRSIKNRTQRTTAFWSGVGNQVAEVIENRFEHEASLRSQGICTTCEGARRVRRTTQTVNGYSTVTSSYSKIIDCPVCNGSGKR